jgi:two-component system response regulator AtoC
MTRVAAVERPEFEARAGSAPSLARALRLLVVGTDGGTAETAVIENVRQWASDEGAEFESVPDLPRATRRLAADRWDVVFAMLGERSDEELGWWADTLRATPGAPRLVALVSHPSMGLALQAERLGVLDLLTLPLRRADFAHVLERLSSKVDEESIPFPEEGANAAAASFALVGQDPAMLSMYKTLARVSTTTATVLIQGESGTGKEVAARTIHANSLRAAGPFVAVNCAAIPENLLESELFGHEKGAFTGAVARKPGRFELAIGGTLFLDEVADMSLALQAKILRAVQEREIERVGGGEPISVDVRLIAATNRDLREAITQGKFREDLYYRLAVVTIRLPRLVERGDDLVLLTTHFARHFSARYKKRVRAISVRALDALRQHAWSGNIRELRNVIEHAVVFAGDDTIRLEHLPPELRGTPVVLESLTLPDRPDGAHATLAEAEARYIVQVLTATNGTISAAAEILGIHRNTLARKMKEYGL